MSRGPDPAKHQEWRQRLERFAHSDKTVVAFCRDEGVSAPSFYQWSRKFGRGGRTNQQLAKRRRKSPSAFKQLHVAQMTSGVSIRLPSGIVVELGSDLDTIEKIVGQVLDRQAATGTGSC